MRNRATKIMQIEEHIDYHRSHQSEGVDKGKEKDKYKVNRPVSGRSDRFRENRGPQFLSYMPLTVPRE